MLRALREVGDCGCGLCVSGCGCQVVPAGMGCVIVAEMSSDGTLTSDDYAQGMSVASCNSNL